MKFSKANRYENINKMNKKNNKSKLNSPKKE